MYANDEITLFSGVTLTASYADNLSAAQEFRSNTGLSLLVNYNRNAGSANAYLELQVEFSPDGTNWHPYSVWADAGSGVYTHTTVTYKLLGDPLLLPIFIDEVRARYYRVKIQETAVTTTNFGVATVVAYRSEI